MLKHDQRHRAFMRLPRLIRSSIRSCYERVKTIFYLMGFISRRERPLRILGVIDFNEEGFAIGDAMVFQVFLNILMIRHGAQKVDTTYIDDPSHANTRKEAYHRTLYLKRMLSSLHELNPNAGSHFHFDSNAQFADFLQKHREKYVVWPILHGSLTCRGLYDMKQIIDFYHETGSLPRLSCRQELINWAHSFVVDHIGKAKLVVVHLRANPSRRESKNSNIDAWDRFFAAHKDEGSVKFTIIGTKEEIIPKFREYKNLIFAKDFDTTLEQDLSLLQIAHISLCSTSGPGVFPRFAGLPTITFGLSPVYTDDIPEGATYPFLTRYQKVFWGKEPFELIEHEFTALMDKLNKDNWHNPHVYREIDNPKHAF